MNLPVMACMSSCACHIKTLWCRSTVWFMWKTITNPNSTLTEAYESNKEYKTSTKHFTMFCSYIYDLSSAGKNAKLPGYMDYLHLSTADVAILKGSWSVLEEHVTRVSWRNHITKSIDRLVDWLIDWIFDLLIEEHMTKVNIDRIAGEPDPLILSWIELKIWWEKDLTFQVGVDFFIDMMTNHEEIKAVFRQVTNCDRNDYDDD